MTINWLKNSKLTGTATFNKNNIVLNTTFLSKFSKVCNALIGISEDEKSIIVKPLTLDEIEDPKYKDLLIVKVSPFKNFLRIGNSKCVSILEPVLKIKLAKEPVKFNTTWNEVEKYLCIDLTQRLDN